MKKLIYNGDVIVNYNDYRLMKTGDWCSVGMFSEGIYAFQHIGGAMSHSTYYQITKSEFLNFPNNQNDILLNKHRVICSDYLGKTEFNAKDYE